MTTESKNKNFIVQDSILVLPQWMSNKERKNIFLSKLKNHKVSLTDSEKRNNL